VTEGIEGTDVGLFRCLMLLECTPAVWVTDRWYHVSQVQSDQYRPFSIVNSIGTSLP
jgi:hypothetical protein